MKLLIPIAEREYWIVKECTAVLGRSNEYWQSVFDEGKINGYRDGKRAVRYIQASSARAYLESLCKNRPPAPAIDVSMAAARAAQRRGGGATNA